MATPGSSGQRYQGYPYINPIVIDAPTLDAETAARWTNLPRRQVIPPRKEPVQPTKPEIYIDLPEHSDNGNSSIAEGPSQVSVTPIEVVEDKPPDEEPPIVYIDIPESGGSSQYTISDSREDERTQENFVNETILYDPFKDRRIDLSQNAHATLPGTSSSQGNSGPSVSSSSYNYPTKETNIYVPSRTELNTPEERLPSPIPISEFPEPPPAYSEIDRREEELPRTQVVVRDPVPTAVPKPTGRKLVSCPHCGVRGLSLTIREYGVLTHILACLCFFGFGPLTLLIYCFDTFKYRNHYCPNCNELVGYEIPLLCQGMTYSKPQNA